MEKVLAVFSDKINALLKKIPADEFQIRQELDLLSAYWEEVVIKRIEEMRAALEETLKIRDEEFGKLNNHLLLHEQEFKEELSRRLAEERALLEYKLELKEKLTLNKNDTTFVRPQDSGIHRVDRAEGDFAISLSAYGWPLPRGYIRKFDPATGEISKIYPPARAQKSWAQKLLEIIDKG